MFPKPKRNEGELVAEWLLAHMDPDELQKLLLRKDVPPALWRILEGGSDEEVVARPMSGESPANT